MQPLHDHHDGIALGVVEPGGQRVPIEVQGLLPLGIALGLSGIVRVVDDQPGATLAGDRAAGGGRHHDAALGRVELQLLLLIFREVHVWCEPPIGPAPNQPPTAE